MNLYFIKGDDRKSWTSSKLTLKKDASPSKVIAMMEKDGWKSVTPAAFKAFQKKMRAGEQS